MSGRERIAIGLGGVFLASGVALFSLRVASIVVGALLLLVGLFLGDEL